MRSSQSRFSLRRLGLLGVTLGLLAASGLAAFGARTYVVRKSDTLTSIALAHDVSVNQLVSANASARAGHLRVGQLLKIPETPRPSGSPKTSKSDATTKTKSGGLTPPAASGLPQSFQNLVDRTRVKAGHWDFIVVHHSATAMGTPQAMDRYHREERHMENGLAYHFVIGNGNGMGDGQIAIGRRWTEQLSGGHLASEALNARSLGICLVGNFDRDRPTKSQLASLEALTRYLMNRCRIPKSGIKTHQQINPIGTRCPGRLFDETAFLRRLPP